MHMGESLGSTAHRRRTEPRFQVDTRAARSPAVFGTAVLVSIHPPIVDAARWRSSLGEKNEGAGVGQERDSSRRPLLSSCRPPPPPLPLRVSDGGAAVAAGRGGEGGRQGRAAVAHGFSDVGHEEGVAG